MNSELLDQIHQQATRTGAQAVGVSPVGRFSRAPLPYRPESFLPGARSVIVVGVHYPDACVEHCGNEDLQDMHAYGEVQVDMNVLLDMLSYRIASLLDRNGFDAVSFSTSHIWRYRPFGVIDRGFTPDFPHRHAAVAAGLGEFGWNGLVLNKDYGPRIRFNSIITRADLPATPMYAGPALCDKCMRCVQYCHMDAFRKEVAGMDRVVIGDRTFSFPLTNKWRCAWAEHFALGLQTDIPDVIDEKTVLAAKHRFGVFGGEIGNCLRQCLPAPLRLDPPQTDLKVWRRAKRPPAPDVTPFLRDLHTRLATQPDYLASLPVESLPPDVLPSALPGARAVVVAGIDLPRDLPDLEVLDHAGHSIPSVIQEALVFSREEGRRLLGVFGHQAAMLAERLGYDAMPRIALPAERLAACCGFGRFSGDGRVFRTRMNGTNSLFTAIAVTLPLPEWSMPARPVAPGVCTRRTLEDAARTLGADGVGVTPLDRLDGFDVVRQIRGLYPRLKNVLVIGMHYPEGYLAPGPDAPMGAVGTYSFAQYQTHRELGWLALALCRQLSEAGHAALPLTDLCGTASKTLNVRGTPPPDAPMERGMIGLLPYAFIPDHRANAPAAVAAGLGTLGYHGAVLTARHGVRQRFICVLTDLDLPADAMGDVEPRCDECRRCLTACLTAALDPLHRDSFAIGGKTLRIPRRDAPRCDWAQRFGLSGEAGPAYLGSTTDRIPPAAVSLAALTEAMASRDPLQDHFASVLEPCVRVCPAPWREPAPERVAEGCNAEQADSGHTEGRE